VDKVLKHGSDEGKGREVKNYDDVATVKSL